MAYFPYAIPFSINSMNQYLLSASYMQKAMVDT